MRRSGVGLEAVTDWHNLAQAFYLAAQGKRQQPDVCKFRQHLHIELASLQNDVLLGTYRPGPMSSFQIYDPKPRMIHAPVFRDRVLHHALMRHVGPVLDRSLVYDTYACRKGKGTLAAVQRCQQQMRRFPWYVKSDIRAYFASIDHLRLKRMLRQRLKNSGLLGLIDDIIDSYHTVPGKGLPIGALTSQHFANFYLSGLDRFLLERCRVGAMVRYMDDTLWWCKSRESVHRVLAEAQEFVSETLALQIKPTVQINRSAQGVTFCGYRVFPGSLRLSRRRRQRYAACRQQWEKAYLSGDISGAELQSGYASALAITAHADAAGWRRQQLQRYPLHEDLLEV
jgi:retron-type reverse transcriptase